MKSEMKENTENRNEINKNIIIRELDAKLDESILNEIVQYEDKVFGEGSIGAWNVKPFAKYGKIFTMLEKVNEENEEETEKENKNEENEEENKKECKKKETEKKVKLISVVELLSSFQREKAYIYGVFTVKEYEKQGYAKKLIEYVIEHLKNIGISIIELTVQISNKRAVLLYEKIGFKVVEELEDEYGDGNRRYLMALEI